MAARVGDVAGASTWMLGDAFAYGDQFYANGKGDKQIPDGIYAQFAAQTGISEGTLRNAKWVCAALPLSRRRDKLTFGHAQEIVGRVEAEDYDYWIDRVVNEGLSIKALRENIRKAKALYGAEMNDTGDRSFLETASQFVRDYQTASPKFTPQFRAEVKKILAPVTRDLG